MKTQDAIKRRIGKIEEQLRSNTTSMGNLDVDGDMMDDPLLHRLMDERIQLEDEANKLRGYLGEGVKVLNRPESYESVSPGHLVSIIVKYPDGETNEISVSIGSTLDKKYLEQGGDSNSPNHILISEESPLARVLLGRGVNETATYQTDEGQGEVRILGIGNSPFLEKQNDENMIDIFLKNLEIKL